MLNDRGTSSNRTAHLFISGKLKVLVHVQDLYLYLISKQLLSSAAGILLYLIDFISFLLLALVSQWRQYGDEVMHDAVHTKKVVEWLLHLSVDSLRSASSSSSSYVKSPACQSRWK